MDEEGNTVMADLENIDTDKLSEFIQSEVSKSFEAERAKNQTQDDNTQTQTQQVDNSQNQQTDFWGNVVNPYIEPVKQMTVFMNNAAIDKVNFESSDVWEQLEDLYDDGEDDKSALKTKKKEIKAEVEKRFIDLAKKGIPTSREVILKLVVGEELVANAKSFQAKAAKKHAKTQESELLKAKRGSDIAANSLSSMSRDEIFSIPDEKFDDMFAGMTF